MDGEGRALAVAVCVPRSVVAALEIISEYQETLHLGVFAYLVVFVGLGVYVLLHSVSSATWCSVAGALSQDL